MRRQSVGSRSSNKAGDDRKNKPSAGRGKPVSLLDIASIILALACSAIIANLVFSAVVRDVNSDPVLTLYTTQAILEDGTIKLDRYHDMDLSRYHGADFNKHHAWDEYRGHFYNKYPLGPSLFALPFVAVAKSFGWDMVGQNALMQIRIIMFTCAFTYLAIFLFTRQLVSGLAAFVIATVTALGSPLISSNGTALWTHSVSVCVTSLALYLLVRAEQDEDRFANPYVLGSLLFLSYLTRPTSSFFILAVFIYTGMRCRRAGRWGELVRTAGTALVLLLAYMLFNMIEIGAPMTWYYMVFSKTLAIKGFFTGLLGLSISPSRGVLVFSPFLIPLLAATIYYFRKLRTQPLFILAGLWVSIQFLMMCFFTSWPGGWSYGPRLLTDLFPPLALIAALVWRELMDHASPGIRNSAAISFLLLGGLAAYVNSYVGLYNVHVMIWNNISAEESNITNETYSVYFDWKHPQFLVDRKMLVNWMYDIRRLELGDELVDSYIRKNGSLPGLPPPMP